MWNLKNKTNELIKQKLTQKCREYTSGYQWGEGKRKGQEIGRGLRGTNYYV